MDLRLPPHPLIPLCEEPSATALRALRLAGLLPFFREGLHLSCLLVKPVAKVPGLAPPLFQLPKGTRQGRDEKGGWKDIAADEKPGSFAELEPLWQTALREAHEEAGLHPDNYIRLFSWQVEAFSSEKTGRTKEMMIYAGEVRHPEKLDDPDQTQTPIADRRWMTPEAATGQVREDHLRIIRKLEPVLLAWYD